MSLDSSNQLPPSLDPTGPHVATSCFDLLLVELVPFAFRQVAEAAEREAAALLPVYSNQNKRRRASAIDLGKPSNAGPSNNVIAKVAAAKLATTDPLQFLGIGGIGGRVIGMDEEETRKRVFWKLDNIGYRVGLGIVDKFLKDKPRFSEDLDVIKFLCKDLWMIVFQKPIDNLKTNRLGVYILTDNKFKPLTKISLERGRPEMMAQTQPFLYYPAGLIRGALASLNMVATIQPESLELPIASFQIQIVNPKS